MMVMAVMTGMMLSVLVTKRMMVMAAMTGMMLSVLANELMSLLISADPPTALAFLAIVRVGVPRALATTVCCPTLSQPLTCPPARAHWGDGQRARGSARRFLRRSWVGRLSQLF